jgi:hypothetical protein
MDYVSSDYFQTATTLSARQATYYGECDDICFNSFVRKTPYWQVVLGRLGQFKKEKGRGKTESAREKRLGVRQIWEFWLCHKIPSASFVLFRES